MIENDFLNFFQAIMQISLNFTLLAYILTGVILGLIVGILPGLGPPAAIALLFPLSYILDPLSSISILAGIFYGAKYGGAVSSILIGIPGEADAIATMQAGHNFAKKGKAKEALYLANIASFSGSILAILTIVFLSPVLVDITLYFNPLDKFILISSMLILMCILNQGRIYKNFLMLCLGFILASIGLDPIYSGARLSMNFLWKGIDLTALLLGVFGISEILFLVMSQQKSVKELDGKAEKAGKVEKSEQKIPDQELQVFSSIKCTFAILRASFIGFVTGIIPCGAGVTASLTALSLEKKLTKKEDQNKSQWTALAATEAANSSSAIASFAPLLLLGLPTNPIMAALLAALTISGIVPSYEIQASQADFFWSILASLTLGNIILIILALSLTKFLAKSSQKLANASTLPLYSIIIILCLMASFQSTDDFTGVVQCIIFACLGTFLRLRKFNLSPLILAFVLGSRLESYLIQAILSF